MIGELKSYLLDRAGDWHVPTTGEWRYLFYNNYHSNGSDIDLLWFHNRDHYPRVVNKLSRDRTRLEHEFGNLMRVYAAAREWAPEPLSFGKQGPFWSIWMRGVNGVRFSRIYTPTVLRSIVDMIASLHHAIGASNPCAEPYRHKRAVGDPLSFLAESGNAPCVVDGCRRIAAQANPAWLNRLAVIPQHGDLYMGNLLVDGNRWAVVDWENFGSVDLPACDLFTLLLSVLRLNGNESAQWGPEVTSEVPGLVKRYAGRLGLSPADVRLLLPLSLANWAHIQWRSGRAEFLQTFYSTVSDYFERTSCWENIFFGS